VRFENRGDLLDLGVRRRRNEQRGQRGVIAM